MFKHLLILATCVLSFQAPGMLGLKKQNVVEPAMTITKRYLTAREALQMATDLGYPFTSKADFSTKERAQYFVTDGDYVTSTNFETNVRYSYSSFTGYIFTNDNDVAVTSVAIGNFVSQNICFSETIGVYEKVSFGAGVSLETSIGLSAGVHHTVSVNKTFTLEGYDKGTYGLKMRFFTCDKLYLHFRGSTLAGGMLVSNNPATTYSYYFSKRGA